MNSLEDYIKKIEPIDDEYVKKSKQRWDSIAKPLGSLGRLEWAVSAMAGIFGSDNFDIDKKALVVMCADNGVVEEGVTQTGQEVTAIVAENFLDEKSWHDDGLEHDGSRHCRWYRRYRPADLPHPHLQGLEMRGTG